MPPSSHDRALRLLREGVVEIEGRMPYSSNATFLVDLILDDDQGKAIYKPLRGERPLWDFPSGLYRREVAAYELALHMGLDVVPPTIEREGEFGVGSFQWFVDARFEEHYFTLFEARPDLHDQFRAIALFDIVANNTDRKGGHCLIDDDDHVWAIDNGLCFSADFKLRTVIWEFGGEPIPDHLLPALDRVVDGLPESVTDLLDDDEIEAVGRRAEMLRSGGGFPVDSTGHRYPWPLV
jgi:uncharacterized repeat protein (TIGR03843 family)